MALIFNPPQIRDAVQRIRLFQLLDDTKSRQNTLIVGQAAQGKSTLAASYLRTSEKPVVWLQLSGSDNSPGKLYERIALGIASLDQKSHGAEAPADLHTMLGTIGREQRTLEQAPLLFKHLAELTTLVLDDLQVLDENGMGFALVRRLVDLEVKNLRLILISREMPSLDMVRLKMERRLLIIDNQHLAFSMDETRQYFKQAGIEPGINIEKIHQVTEGWPGGITLISESIRQFENIPRLPEKFSGEVFNFFSQEIYSRLAPTVQELLLKTAILQEINLQAVEQITGVSGAQDILSDLENRHMFIQRIDSGNRSPVFKFHDLFREFLLNRLASDTGEAGIRDLNLKAGRFFWEIKDHEQAVEYFIRADAVDDIVKIITIKSTDYVIQGKLTAPERWLSHLPDSVISENPWLLFFQCMTQRIKAGRKNVSRLEQACALFEKENDMRGMLLSTAYLIEAGVFVRLPSPKIVWWINRGEAVLKEMGKSYRFPWARALLWQMIGLGYIAGDGNIPKGISACRTAILLARQMNNPALIFNASITMTLGCVQAGNFKQANDLLLQVENMACPEQHPEYRALKNIVDIEFELKNGRLDSARDLLDQSEADIEKFGLIFLYPGFIEAKAYYLVYAAQYHEARQMADHLNDFSILEGNDFYKGISHRIKALSDLFEKKYPGALEQAEQAVSHLNKAKKGDIHHFLARQLEGVILHRNHKPAQAKKSLLSSLEYFKEISSDLCVAETQIALGLVLWDQEEKESALGYLQQGFDTALQKNYLFFPLLSREMMGFALLIAAAYSGQEISEKYARSLVPICHGPTLLSRMNEILSQAGKKEKSGVIENLRPLYKSLLPRLRIISLGHFEVRSDASVFDPILFERSRPVLLLKSIVLHGARDIPREVLIDDLWPDADARSGEKNFKINLHRLRRAIEPEYEKAFGYSYIIQKAGLISLDPDLVDLDTDEFIAYAKTAMHCQDQNREEEALSHYDTAIGIYGGDYFSEEPYIEWIQRKREMYRSMYMEILQHKAELHEEMDQPETAIGVWRTLLQADPCLEKAYQNLMILYADTGRKRVAIDLFEDCKKMLENELGADPDPQTIRIYETICAL